jgi:hypothetical protein
MTSAKAQGVASSPAVAAADQTASGIGSPGAVSRANRPAQSGVSRMPSNVTVASMTITNAAADVEAGRGSSSPAAGRRRFHSRSGAAARSKHS